MESPNPKKPRMPHTTSPKPHQLKTTTPKTQYKTSTPKPQTTINEPKQGVLGQNKKKMVKNNPVKNIAELQS